MFGKKLRNYFFTGLFAILPITITVYILVIGFRWADGILGNLVKNIIGRSIPGLGLLFVLLVILLAGLIATNFFGRRMVAFAERLIMQVPVVGSIYGTTKQITEAISSPEKAVFRSVVLVEYPRKGIYSPGFKIGDPPEGVPEEMDKHWVTVFIPTVPNPASGFVIVVPEEEVLTLPMSIEDGFKYFVSAGVVKP
ncbi:MAG TPA: DUF502 domain-containing protein, partial [Bacillota bacterium]|nr:DUF502 domain-containing protein [Bacillota bacterium]